MLGCQSPGAAHEHVWGPALGGAPRGIPEFTLALPDTKLRKSCRAMVVLVLLCTEPRGLSFAGRGMTQQSWASCRSSCGGWDGGLWACAEAVCAETCRAQWPACASHPPSFPPTPSADFRTLASLGLHTFEVSGTWAGVSDEMRIQDSMSL